jgi:aminopeptidase N
MSESIAMHKTTYLKDYRPPDYRIETVNLQFELDETRTRVGSLMTVVCTHDRCEGIHPLVLNGRTLCSKRSRSMGSFSASTTISSSRVTHDPAGP